MRKPELCLGFISSSCVHKDEQCPEPGMMAMARLSSSPPRRILLLTLLVFLLAFVPFSAGQMSSHAEDDEAGDATVVHTETESYHRRSKVSNQSLLLFFVLSVLLPQLLLTRLRKRHSSSFCSNQGHTASYIHHIG
jgi:hypothetical protein